MELWGPDRPIAEIGWDELEELRKCYQTKYPSRRSTRPQYKGLTLGEIYDSVKVPEEDRIQGSSLDDKFRFAKDFFEFLRVHPETQPHFSLDASKQLAVKAQQSESYVPWTHEEMKRILESRHVHESFTSRGKNRLPGGMFWLLAMLLYTGARQMEIMGLRREDFELDGEHPLIHIRAHQHRPGVKTIESTRWVPIHRHLIQLGLRDWLDSRPKNNWGTVWPSFGDSANKWSNRFRDGITEPLGLHVSRKKVLHSFRSAFDSAAAHQMPDAPRRLITGHVGQGTDYRHYIRQVQERIPQYSELVNQLDFGLDLGLLESLWRQSVGSKGPPSRRGATAGGGWPDAPRGP